MRAGNARPLGADCNRPLVVRDAQCFRDDLIFFRLPRLRSGFLQVEKISFVLDESLDIADY